MSTLANDAVNIPPTSTGPRTEAGKSKSSRNAIRTGLYAARDFVRPEEEEEYAQTLIKLMDELTPENSVEQTFATEIMGATWRLRRCRLVEEAFGLIEDLNVDPMIDERTEKQQKSVDRARAQSHLILRRSLDELRKLQSARQLRNPTPEAVRVTREELKAIAKADVEAILAERKLSSFCKPADPAPPAPSSFCEKPKFTPRNAPCPCGSGTKYKRCCGKNAPPVLNKAA
jgi:vacuolar-type H+-ATPase subunit H